MRGFSLRAVVARWLRIIAILLGSLLVLYTAAYLVVVRRVLRAEPPTRGIKEHVWVKADLGGETTSLLFEPAHWIDRAFFRRHYWSGWTVFETTTGGELVYDDEIRIQSWVDLLGLDSLTLSDNGREAIRQELLNPGTIHLLAKSGRLSDSDLATMRFSGGSARYSGIELYQLGDSKLAFTILEKQLSRYARARLDGHSREFVLAAIAEQTSAPTIADLDIRALVSDRGLLPASWLKRVESGTITNKAGVEISRRTTITFVNGRNVTNETRNIQKGDEVRRWVHYTVIDGAIAWQYAATFRPDGSLENVYETKCDAKESDPRYQSTIKEVQIEVKTQMQRDGSYDQFGSIHEFWRLKKEKLKARGIEWRDPAELNVDTIYD